MGLSGVTTTRRLATFSKFFCRLSIGSFPTFKGPLLSLANTPLKCLVSCLLTLQQCHFKFPMGLRSCWYPWKWACWFSSKAGASSRTAMVPCPSPQLSPQLDIPSITNGDVAFPNSSSHLNCPFLQFLCRNWSSHAPYAFASMVKASYYCHKSVVRKTLLAAPVDTGLLIISLLTVLPLSLYANLSLPIQFAPWRVAQLFGLYEVPLLLHPSEGVG